MTTIWFTADHHFNHTNIITYCNRPFSSIEEMNEELILRWNGRVDTNDIVYHLGDFGFGKTEIIANRLNGMKYLIPGSHDRITPSLRLGDSLIVLPEIWAIKNERHLIIMCHYAMRTWEKSHYNSWHLFGHSHGKLPTFGKSFDIGVDTHNFYPYSFDEVKKIMDRLPDNFNLVRSKEDG
jgi:calcineurin-like phosphoesterase family protein